MREYKLYFGGQWMDQTDGWIADDFNPMDGSLFAKVHMGGPTDIQRAVDNLPGKRQWAKSWGPSAS